MKYFFVTLKHKWFVLLVGIRIGVPLWRLIVHDWSKFLPSELPHYQRHFCGDKGDPAAFDLAWLRHQNRHEHHPHFWITRSEYAPSAINNCLPMSQGAILEMVADWSGSKGRAYTRNWDISTWTPFFLGNQSFHPNTLKELVRIVQKMGGRVVKEMPNHP